MLRIFKDIHFNFVGRRKIAYIISLAVFLTSSISLILLWNSRQGIDFTGGTIIRLSVEEGDLSTAELRSTIQNMGIGRSIIQESTGEGGKKGFIIRMPLLEKSVDEEEIEQSVEDSSLSLFFNNYSKTENVLDIYVVLDTTLSLKELADTNMLTLKGFNEKDSITYYMMAGISPDSLVGLEKIDFPEKIQIIPPIFPLTMLNERLDSIGFTENIFFSDIENENQAIRILLDKNKWAELESALLPEIEQAEIVQSMDMQVKDILEDEYPGLTVTIEGSEHVGARISRGLKWRALWVVFIGIIAILAYISIRFTYRFGVAAIVALIHDIFITAGIYAISGFEFNVATIAGLLTIIGYSINDSIVVSDRIRETNKLNKGKDFSWIVNKSINATLGRTVITSTTTLIVLVSLFIFGSSIIKDFAFILMVGVLVGTYSSIFVVSPIVVDWERKFPTPVGKSRA